MDAVSSVLRWIQRVDESLLRWAAEHLRTLHLDGFMLFYTRLGNAGWIFIAVAVVLLVFRKTRRAGGSALAGMTLGLLCTNVVLKPMVARARPWVVMSDFVPLTVSSDMNSFPSGHTCAAFAFGAAVCAVLPSKWAKAAALIAAALMGFSRIYVGVHFVTDVLAGAAVGVACGCLGAWVVGKFSWFRRGEG